MLAQLCFSISNLSSATITGHDVMKMPFYLYPPQKIHNPSLITRKTGKFQFSNILLTTLGILLNIVKVKQKEEKYNEL
jgi:hypothetical protein